MLFNNLTKLNKKKACYKFPEPKMTSLSLVVLSEQQSKTLRYSINDISQQQSENDHTEEDKAKNN